MRDSGWLRHHCDIAYAFFLPGVQKVGEGGSLSVLEGQGVGKWSWKVLDLSLIGAAGNVS
jgi:hypothetical protein